MQSPHLKKVWLGSPKGALHSRAFEMSSPPYDCSQPLPGSAAGSALPTRPLAVRLLLPEHLFCLLFLSMLVVLRLAYRPGEWHGFSDYTISASFGCMVAVSVLAVTSCLPRWFAGNRVSWLGAAREAGSAVYDWLPFSVCAFIYENLHDLTNLVRPTTFDDTLMRLDGALFGVQPTIWLEAHAVTPLLTDWMAFSYSLYFFFPAALLVALYRRGDERRFRTLSVALLLAFLVGFAFYVTIPAIGPRYWLRDQYQVAVLSGTLFRGNASEIFKSVEFVQRDCFPSLHTAISALALIHAHTWRDVLPGRGAWRWIFLPLVLSLWASTVYLRQHWFVDVLGGLALAAALTWAAPRLVAVYFRLASRTT